MISNTLPVPRPGQMGVGFTALPSRRVYLDGTDLERDCEAFMRFRLTYEGPLLSSQPGAPDKRWEHKHDIRRKIHPQLKLFWETNKFLRFAKISPSSHMHLLPPSAGNVWGDDPHKYRPLVEVLAGTYTHHRDLGYQYVPLVREDIDLSCSLRILCLRLDHDAAVLPGRDIDNRIKTLIDALTMPLTGHGPPTKDKQPLPAGNDEKPFFVLLDDDRRVTHLEVETDTLLAPVPIDADESYVRLVISVEIRPYNVTMFNLNFA